MSSAKGFASFLLLFMCVTVAMLNTNADEDPLVILEVEGYFDYSRVKDCLKSLLDSFTELNTLLGGIPDPSEGIQKFTNLVQDYVKSGKDMLEEFEKADTEAMGFQVFKLLAGSKQFLGYVESTTDAGEQLTKLSSAFTEAEKSDLAQIDFSKSVKALEEFDSFFDGITDGLNAFLSKLDGDDQGTDDDGGSIIDPEGCTCSPEDVVDDIERLRQDAKDVLSLVTGRQEAYQSLCQGLKSIVSLNE